LPFFSLTATSLSWIVPLSLHDALPIYNSFDTQKVCTFGCPVTAGSHTVVVACNDDKTCIFFLILHCSVIDAHHFTSRPVRRETADRKSTRLNSSHVSISYAVFCLKKKT